MSGTCSIWRLNSDVLKIASQPSKVLLWWFFTSFGRYEAQKLIYECWLVSFTHCGRSKIRRYLFYFYSIENTFFCIALSSYFTSKGIIRFSLMFNFFIFSDCWMVKMDLCVFCSKLLGNEEPIVTLRQKGCKNIRKASIARESKIKTVPGQKVHIRCRQEYINPKAISTHKRKRTTSIKCSLFAVFRNFWLWD